MGNESSVPGEGGAGSDIEDLEQLEQHQQAGGNSNTPKSVNDAQDGKSGRTGPRAGARMIGAVFGKSNRNLQANSSSASTTNQQQQPQQHATPQDATSTSSADGNAMDHSESSHNSFYDASMTAATSPPSASADPNTAGVISHDYFAAAQQQSQHQQAASLPKQASSESLDVDRGEHPAVGVMFEKTPTKKSLFPGRATARGAALISSMRNLTVGAFSKATNNTKKDETDWEKQWDEDEEDSDDDDDSSSSETGTASAPLHQQIRPPMDVGHSEMPVPPQPSSMGSSSFQSAATAAVDAPPPSMLIPSKVAMQQQPHDLASEWDMAGIQPPTAVVDSAAIPPSTQSQSTVLSSSSTALPQAPPSQQQSVVEKPNVQMFLPMLRVLGKGSFGKVRPKRFHNWKIKFCSFFFLHEYVSVDVYSSRLSWSRSALATNAVVCLL